MSRHSKQRSSRPSRSQSQCQPRSRSRGQRYNYDPRDYYKSYRKGCNPLFCCKCAFGGPTLQSLFLLFVPFSISILCFLVGFYTLPMWKYNDSTQGSIGISAQGYTVDNQDSGIRKFLYETPWPAPIDGIPLLLLFHFILSILLLTYLVFIISVCIYAIAHRRSKERKRDEWAKVVRKPKGWERAITILLTLATGVILVLDNTVWGIARSKGYNLNPDILGYFVNIVGLLLWVLWVILQGAATHDREEYYVQGGGRVYAR
ncbi:uncharacterized protein IL334_007829 [Kwoniella shivajii]|uniref:Uncharacterized protein n=1 Tax=Kwoniella shivajii TaxID=564305 RepID=A0ABZ1DAB8_9TREE|nr:hypothetical protein IL334_007829 [Kwoniella shivajii]